VCRHTSSTLVDRASFALAASAQNEASRALLAHDSGVFVGPPGIGKTVLGTHMIAERGRAALVLVHRMHVFERPDC
jgi:superfamily II DNA or RNA helicase